MELNKLKNFISVVEQMNITRAATDLYVSQQSLSRQIISLERELKVRLFSRTPKLVLTPEGECFEKFARQVIKLESELHTQLHEISNQVPNQLMVCIGPTRSRIFMPTVLPEFSALYPDVEICTFTGSDDELNRMILEGNSDFYIGSSVSMDRSLKKIVLYTEYICLLVSEKYLHQLFQADYDGLSNKLFSYLDISLFKEAHFLLTSHGAKYRSLLENYFNKHSFIPKKITESNNIDMLTQLSLQGMGVSFVTTPHALVLMEESSSASSDDLFIFPINDLSIHIAIAYNPNRRLSLVAKHFLKIVTDRYSKGHEDIFGVFDKLGGKRNFWHKAGQVTEQKHKLN